MAAPETAAEEEEGGGDQVQLTAVPWRCPSHSDTIALQYVPLTVSSGTWHMLVAMATAAVLIGLSLQCMCAHTEQLHVLFYLFFPLLPFSLPLPLLPPCPTLCAVQQSRFATDSLRKRQQLNNVTHGQLAQAGTDQPCSTE